MTDYSAYWDDPLHSERQEHAAAAAYAEPYWPEGPTAADIDDPPYRAADDPYRGKCGGCGKPVAADRPGGACLWKKGPWHPACRRADPDYAAYWVAGA